MTSSTAAPAITGVDFVALPAKDIEASRHFYGTVLGLPFVKNYGDMPASEYQAGNLTLAIMQTDAFGFAVAARDRRSGRRGNQGNQIGKGIHGRAIMVCARSMSASPVPDRAANRPSAHWLRLELKSGPSVTSLRSRTTAAVRRSVAGCKFAFTAQIRRLRGEVTLKMM